MNTRELLEMCQLDALGLLDDQERTVFDAAFLAAPPEIRAQLRREQARWVRTDFIGVDAEPPEGLREAVLTDVGVAAMRDRVLAAVHDQIELTARSAPAPAATIIAAAHDAGRTVPALRPVRRVSRLWRATALGFASATVALCATTLHLRDRFDRLQVDIRQEAELSALASIPGGTHDLLFNRSNIKAVFTPVIDGFKGEASLDYDPKDGKARLYCLNLPTDARKRYTLVALDASGERLMGPSGRPVMLCDAFTSKGGLQVIQDVSFTPATTARVALCEVSDDTPGGIGREVMRASLV